MRTIRKETTEICVGDILVMTPRVLWTVLKLEPYVGNLPELNGSVIATTDRGGITLENHMLHEVVDARLEVRS